MAAKIHCLPFLMHIYVCIYICILCIYASCIYMHLVYICIYVCIYTYTHIYTHTQIVRKTWNYIMRIIANNNNNKMYCGLQQTVQTTYMWWIYDETDQPYLKWTNVSHLVRVPFHFDTLQRMVHFSFLSVDNFFFWWKRNNHYVPIWPVKGQNRW